MYFSVKLLLVIILLVLASCSGPDQPATPLETFKTYTKAFKQKDTTTMKLLLSRESIKMHEQEAKAQNVPLDEVVKRETLFSEGQTTVEFRNEKIEGERATLEVKNSFQQWETIPFVKEDGEWKIDKIGYADLMRQQIEQETRELDSIINQGRQTP